MRCLVSAGLFRAAIQLSGVANSPMAYTEDNVERARALVARLSNGTADALGNTASLERALLRASWEDITRQSVYMQYHSVSRARSAPAARNAGNPSATTARWDAEARHTYCPRLLFATTSTRCLMQGWGLKYNWFVPSPERRPLAPAASRRPPVDADGEPVVLTRDPESLLRDPVLPRVPTLTGVVSMEGLKFAARKDDNYCPSDLEESFLLLTSTGVPPSVQPPWRVRRRWRCWPAT